MLIKVVPTQKHIHFGFRSIWIGFDPSTVCMCVFVFVCVCVCVCVCVYIYILLY